MLFFVLRHTVIRLGEQDHGAREQRMGSSGLDRVHGRADGLLGWRQEIETGAARNAVFNQLHPVFPFRHDPETSTR